MLYIVIKQYLLNTTDCDLTAPLSSDRLQVKSVHTAIWTLY